MKYDVAVIGGGASGLACAVQLTQNKNLKVAILEAGERLGKKLAATGNGQGNISNADMTAFHFHGGGAGLAAKIACADPEVYKSIFDCLFVQDERGRVYPAGKQASALTDCLIRKLNGKADVLLSAKVVDIDRSFKLVLSDGRTVSADCVVLCAGGKAQKQFKTDGSAYALAQKFGHKLTALYPSLVQLKTQTTFIKSLKGIRADCIVNAFSEGKKLTAERGDVIFTDYGVSGNAVFSVSSAIADKHDVELALEFLPDISARQIKSNLERRRKEGYRDNELLSGNLHNTLGRSIIARAGSDIEDIIFTLKNFSLPVLGTLGFDYAQVTRGGIDVHDVTENLESKLIKNLFFAGEILDVDGDCGGYNLQWAFASGIHVAKEIIKRKC